MSKPYTEIDSHGPAQTTGNIAGKAQLSGEGWGRSFVADLGDGRYDVVDIDLYVVDADYYLDGAPPRPVIEQVISHTLCTDPDDRLYTELDRKRGDSIELPSETTGEATSARARQLCEAFDPAQLQVPWPDATHPPAEPDPHTQQPRIEIAGYRDPDGEVTLTVFVNGQPTDNVTTQIVDPGAGYPYPVSEWRQNTAEIGRGSGSTAWKSQLIEYYRGAEDRYTENDTTPATDAEPTVTDVDQFDPAQWMHPDGVLHATSGEGLATDNTTRAGQALFAVQAHHAHRQRATLLHGLRDPHRIAPFTAATHQGAVIAVGAYAQLTQPNASIHSLPNLVADLLSDLHHLADAKNITLAMPADQHSAPLHATMTALIADLERAYPVWLAETSELHTPPGFDDLTATAYRRYQDEVTGTI